LIKVLEENNMPKIVLEHVTKRWNNFFGVDDLNLVMEDNSFVTLLGPSGCGKTTTLRMIAGLETPTSGKITIGDKVVFDSDNGINVPPSKRKVGFLFQNYALWPNMTVYQNISFGLKNVKEEMPLIDFDALNNERISEILSKPKELIELINDCKDKNGKIEKDKALIHIIDNYQVSMFTAKTIFGLNIQEGKLSEVEIEKLVEDFKKKSEENVAKDKKDGYEVNDKYELLKNGKVILKVRKLKPEEIDLAVRKCSRTVKIGEFMDRYPNELSGGQQQRVAIARTLAPNPHVLFMDEPLSNLDAKLRLEMRGELQRLHASTGATFVYVTHDQLEAMTLATKICLINNGVLQQYEEPLKVYHEPVNLFVADFVGNPTINFIEVKGKQAKDGSINLNFFEKESCTFVPNKKFDLNAWRINDNKKIEANKKALDEKKKQKGFIEKNNKDVTFKYHIPMVDAQPVEEEVVLTDDDYVLGIRPDSLQFGKTGKIEGTIYSSMPTGMETTVRLSIDGYLLTGVMFGGITYKLDEKIKVSFATNNILLFDRKTGKLICDGSIK